jgi:hypothetical protein
MMYCLTKRQPDDVLPEHPGNLQVRGLPYRSSPADILTFFQGYQYLPDSLQIGLDSLGRPSGRNSQSPEVWEDQSEGDATG